jgi:L-lactate dehydrogenase complex protein LldG
MAARETILAKIRAQLGLPGSVPGEQELTALRAYLAAHPQGPSPGADWPDLAHRFRERATALGSTVDVLATPDDAPAAVARYLEARTLPKVGVCWAELTSLPWREAGIDLQPRPTRGDDLLGVTGAYCAIAETGTLMLLSGAATPAATSLLPETHVAVLRAARIVKSMEDAWALLRQEYGRLPRAVNFISGPSRTADIEQTIVIGAHGPYRVHIIVVHP